jgi:hypothetical protein
MTAKRPPWKLTGPHAELTCGPLSGRVVLDDPRGGLAELAWHGQACPAFEVLRCSFPEDAHVVDAYIRGNDLVIAWSQSEKCAVAPQLYCRSQLRPELGAAGIELVISVQTSLLESRPGTIVRSLARDARLFHAMELAADAFRECTENQWHNAEQSPSLLHLTVLRDEASGVSYAEVVHPSDFGAMQLVVWHNRKRGAQWTLFQKPELEKGVIRRARVCGWFLPAASDLAAAVELARQFIDEPLPLTA